jgi:hypothetical protein
MEKFDQVPKTPPFSHNQNSPPQETKFCNKSILEKSKVLTLLFSKFSSGSWSISFGLNFSPFGIKHQNRIILGPLTPLPHQKCQLRAKGKESISMNLEVSTLILECSGSLFIVQVHLSLSMYLWNYIKYTQTNRLVSKGQVVAHLPLNMCIIHTWTCEVRTTWAP